MDNINVTTYFASAKKRKKNTKNPPKPKQMKQNTENSRPLILETYDYQQVWNIQF